MHENCNHLFGYYALKLGLDESINLLDEYKQQNSIQLATQWPPPATALKKENQLLFADPHLLPFDDDSIDLVVVHHILEHSQTPHQIIRQAARVLIPEGKLVIFGSNPISLYGIIHCISRLTGRTWRNNMPTAWRIKDWLQLLGFRDIVIHYQHPYTLRLIEKLNIKNSIKTKIMNNLLVNSCLGVNGGWCVLATKHKYAKIISRSKPKKMRLTRLGTVRSQSET